ncbi:Retrotransposable element Tf2 155 kDa protein type 3, partial [Glycine soja]
EAMNRVVEQYLRAFVHQKPSSWGHYLIWAEWSYNTLTHSATGMSPYEITFAVEEWLTQRDRMLTSLVKKLSKAQQHMKEIANQQCRDVSYKEGDQVLVKLRPRRQTSVSGGVHSKLAKRFYGPF